MSFEGGAPLRTDRSVRRLGSFLFPLILAEGVVGAASASVGGSAVPAILVLHIGLGLTVVALSGDALWVASRLPGWTVRLAAGITFGGSLSAAITGSLFLAQGLGGAAVIDRVLALVALAGATLMILRGSVRLAGPASRRLGTRPRHYS